MVLKESKFYTNGLASKRKKFNSMLLDFFAHAALCLIIFGIFLACGNSFPYIGEAKDSYQVEIDNVMKYVNKTRLQEISTANDSEGELISVEEGFKTNLRSLIKTTYYYHSSDADSPLSYSDLNENNVETSRDVLLNETFNFDESYKFDNLGFFYLSYREVNKDDLKATYVLNGIDYLNKYSFFYKGILGVEKSTVSTYLEKDLSFDYYILSKSILNKSTAILLHDYLILGHTTNTEAKTIYNALYTIYGKAIEQGVNEIETNSTIYNVILASFSEKYAEYTKRQVSLIGYAYAISFLLYFVALPLLLRNEQTLGMKTYHLYLERLDGKKPTILDFFIRGLILFLTQLVATILGPVILGKTSLLTVSLGGGVRFLYILLGSLIILIGSSICFYFSKDHVFLCDYASRLIIKDGDIVDSSKIKDVELSTSQDVQNNQIFKD